MPEHSSDVLTDHVPVTSYFGRLEGGRGDMPRNENEITLTPKPSFIFCSSPKQRKPNPFNNDVTLVHNVEFRLLPRPSKLETSLGKPEDPLN
ncbi:hypothetical protein TNCV_3848811 [Trichonephila clavipes]|uniref:Uncharacterized protein n=1 Tax=Trichonephila clavipes TaxID=2585209 RepID=A0A8X6REN6_TRICX|nr:hypothetical protein TNCV_3848811 [Trichonephila clavipes]